MRQSHARLDWLLPLTFGLLLLVTGQSVLAQRPIADARITRLQTERMKNPVGIDEAHPRFSWQIESPRRSADQVAYRVLVASHPDSLRPGAADMWDSRRVDSNRSVDVPYDGRPLRSGQRYFWKVRVWIGGRGVSPWSSRATFHMGFLERGDWKARWIGAPSDSVSAPLLRKSFRLGKPVKEAYVYVSGLGFYELYLNGERVADHVLDPGQTEYSRRVLYETYEVTDLLQGAENVIGMVLGKGQFSPGRRKGRYNKLLGEQLNPYGAPRGLLQLEVTFTDGTDRRIVTDTTWRTSPGPIIYNDFYGGEDYDARREKPGWTTPGYSATDWRPVIPRNDWPLGKPDSLDAQLLPPVRVTETITPVRRIHPRPGIYVFDLGQNIAGWWRLTVKGERGTRVTVRGSERLQGDRFPQYLEKGDRIDTTKAYHRDAYTTYILRGGGKEAYEPDFFYTGFRYVQVEVDEPETLEHLAVEGRVVHTDMDRIGHFRSSSDLINAIYRNTVWSIRGNMHSLPTDCPHREKLGWAADGHLIAQTAMSTFGGYGLWTKWLNDLRDGQAIAGQGAVPDVVPQYGGPSWRGHLPTHWGGSGTPAWGSAYPFVYWAAYRIYGDERMLRRHYHGIRRWVDYLSMTTKANLLSTATEPIIPWGRGEWSSPAPKIDTNWTNKTPVPLTSTAYYYRSARIVAQAAEILGKTDDAERYFELAGRIKESFNRRFFEPDQGYYGSTQTANLIALQFDLVPEKYRQAVIGRVIDLIDKNEGHLSTGFLGTDALLEVLAEYGLQSALYHVITRPGYPGWPFMIENGATTMWETWNGTHSQNHFAFGVVAEFFYEELGGIKLPEAVPGAAGYRTVEIAPYIPEELTEVETSIRTPRGFVQVHWRKAETQLHLDVTAPPNTRLRVGVPTGGRENVQIWEGATLVWKDGIQTGDVAGLEESTAQEERVRFEVESGRYQFRVQPLP